MMPRMVATLMLLMIVHALSGLSASADETPLHDADNPRNVRFSGMILEYVEISPKKRVQEIGDEPGLPESREIRLRAHVRNLTDRPAVPVVHWGSGSPVRGEEPLAPGEAGVIRQVMLSSVVDVEATVRVGVDDPDAPQGVRYTDSALLHGPRALRVALLIDKATLAEGDEQFGSFVRRMRKSFEDLHALFDDVEATTAGGLVKREKIKDRFRIDHAEVYDMSADTRPELFDDHPRYDLVIACNARGPLCCFWLPAYSIGHNFQHEPSGRGLWSAWGEQALWHEMLHFRGVQDFYLNHVPKGALPGRASREIELPRAYRQCIMNSPYQEPRISGLASRIANFKAGIARVGTAEEPGEPYGHLWKWLPDRVKIHVDRGGRPLTRGTLRWWRARPGEFDGRRQQGVEHHRPPDGEALLNRLGEAVIGGDYLGALLERPERSYWLLFEVEYEGARRFGLVHVLWLNEQFLLENRHSAVVWADWESLEIVEANVEAR